jgi:chromosome segregation ATPase
LKCQKYLQKGDRLKQDEQLIAQACRTWEQCKQHDDAINDFKSRMSGVSDHIDRANSEYDEIKKLAMDSRAQKKLRDTLRDSATRIARLRDEERDYKREISNLELEISQSHGTTKTMKELAEEKDRMDAAIDTKKKHLAKLQKDVTR